ncbi:hypothetical protein FRC01_003453 [Tulasnella sp. 417]|nr:hypothetical protein FRC01_003453 [Tulasnella sp. 417]
MELSTELDEPSAVTEELRRHNDALPIHHLPPELLCEVFKHARRKKKYRGLLAIRSVCKYWMEIVDSSPEFWTFVSSIHSENRLDMILQRSKNQLLSIEYDDEVWSDEPRVSIESLTRFLERVTPLADRWKSLDYMASPNADHNQIFDLQFRNLEVLEIRTDAVPSIYIPSFHAPKLRYVELWGCYVDWGSLSDLRVFMITGSSSGPGINETYLLLNACPRLEMFEIRGAYASPADDSISDLPSTPILLPHLKNLILFEVTVTPHSRLLPLIDAPNLQRLFLYHDFNRQEALQNTMFEPVERFFGSYAHAFNKDRDRAQLHVGGSRYSFTFSLGACNMVFNFPFDWRWDSIQHDYLAELSAALSRFDGRVCDKVKAIHFSGTRAREDLSILGVMLQDHFPNVEELLITLSSSEGKPDAHFVLEALGLPLHLYSGPKWLFPGLTTLHLKARREALCDGVLGIVEARRHGEVQAIKQISIKNGRIQRDNVARLKQRLQEFRTNGTRYVDSIRAMEPTTESVVTSAAAENGRRRHNDELPVHHLPPELLCKVFTDARKKRRYRGLFAIRSVCKYWMEIVDSSPELWTFVSLSHNANLLDMILQKAKNQLLSIEYDDGSWSGDHEVSSDRITHFLGGIIPLVGRWRSLTYVVSVDANHDQILDLQFPNLETLKLQANAIPSIPIRVLHAPKLRHVDVWGFSVDWGLLSDLRVLMITGSTFGPTIDEVYLMLTACPALENFQIQGCLALRAKINPLDDLPSTPVSLPHLQYLVLSEVTITPYSRLLPFIDAPKLRRLYFYRGADRYGADRNTLFQPVERFFGSYAHALNNPRDHARLRISGSRKSFTISTGACEMLFNYPFDWTSKGDRDDFLTRLSAALSKFDGRLSDNITAIHFGGTRSREDLIILGPIFQSHFSHVEELRVTLSSSEQPPDAHFVLEALASPLPLEGGVGWLFPKLTTLHLKACRNPICDGVLGVVEARRNGGVQAIQRVSIKKGRIGRDIAVSLKADLKEFHTDGTRYLDTDSKEA